MKRMRLGLVGLLLAATAVAHAQVSAPPTASDTPGSAPASVPIPLKYERTPLEAAIRHLATRTGRSILLDDTVKGSTALTFTGEAATIEDALTRITNALGLKWQKIYLSDKEATPTGDQARRAARALEAAEASGVIVEEPTTGKASLLMRSLPSALDFEAKVKAAWPHMRPHYVLSNPRSSAKRQPRREEVANRKNGPVTAEDFAAMERERMQIFLRLSPEQRVDAMSQAMDMFLQTDPGAMQEMMQAGMQAWMQTMQKMTPAQRQEFFQRSLQMMQSIPPETWKDIFGMFRPQ